MKDVGANQVLHVDIWVNGGNPVQNGNTLALRNRASAEDTYTQSSFSAILNLNVNDYIEFAWFGGCNALTGHDSFVIHYLG
jgi:hypothetical protein